MTKERRLMIDMAGIRQAYERKEVSNIGIINFEYNLAD